MIFVLLAFLLCLTSLQIPKVLRACFILTLNIVCLDQRVSLASTHAIILDVFNCLVVPPKKKKINKKKKGDKRDLKIS